MKIENQRFRLVREAFKGLNQNQFGQLIGLTQGGVSDIMREKKNIGVSAAVRDALYEKLKVSRVWFETGIGDMFAGEKPTLSGFKAQTSSASFTVEEKSVLQDKIIRLQDDKQALQKEVATLREKISRLVSNSRQKTKDES